MSIQVHKPNYCLSSFLSSSHFTVNYAAVASGADAAGSGGAAGSAGAVAGAAGGASP